MHQPLRRDQSYSPELPLVYLSFRAAGARLRALLPLAVMPSLNIHVAVKTSSYSLN